MAKTMVTSASTPLADLFRLIPALLMKLPGRNRQKQFSIGENRGGRLLFHEFFELLDRIGIAQRLAGAQLLQPVAECLVFVKYSAAPAKPSAARRSSPRIVSATKSNGSRSKAWPKACSRVSAPASICAYSARRAWMIDSDAKSMGSKFHSTTIPWPASLLIGRRGRHGPADEAQSRYRRRPIRRCRLPIPGAGGCANTLWRPACCVSTGGFFVNNLNKWKLFGGLAVATIVAGLLINLWDIRR